MSQVIWNSDIDVYDHNVMALSVAANIARYLDIPDLISFGKVSRNTHKVVNSPAIWISRFEALGLWELAVVPAAKTFISAQDLVHLSDPLTCFDRVLRYPKLAQLQMIRIYKSLHPYYSEILMRKLYDTLGIFKDYLLPKDQAKLLNNLLTFNMCDCLDLNRVSAREALESLCEVFENAVLRELEIQYDRRDYERTKTFADILINLGNEQTLIDFFLQKSSFDNQANHVFDIDLLCGGKYFVEGAMEGDIIQFQMNMGAFRDHVQGVAETLNCLAEVIDLIFPPTVAMMCKVCEELISDQVREVIIKFVAMARERELLLVTVPTLYELYQVDLQKYLTPSQNAGLGYHAYLGSLFDMVFESISADYMRQELSKFKHSATMQIQDWQLLVIKHEQETSRNILKLVKEESKNDFLATFRKVFTISGSSGKRNEETDANYSKMEARARILSENISLLDKVLSPKVVIKVLDEAKVSLGRLSKFKAYTMVNVQNDIFAKMQQVFITVIESVGNDHIRPAFEKGILYLLAYNPSSKTYTSTHKETFERPLAFFFELSNTADLIIQMIDLFYREEMIARHLVKNENSVLNPSLQTKKKLELVVDSFVADGLNISVDVLVNEIEQVYGQDLCVLDYNPPVSTSATFGTTSCAERAVKILEQNINLLGDSADKSIVDVFQQEMAERFFQIVVKILKASTISVVGATNLISDLNLYFDFIVANINSNKRIVIPLFQSLKKVGNIFLISGDDAKAIAKLVSDLSKFNGIFTQEEIYEFVQRRKDWNIVRRHVEKVLYGFGFADCCVM